MKRRIIFWVSMVATGTLLVWSWQLLHAARDEHAVMYSAMGDGAYYYTQSREYQLLGLSALCLIVATAIICRLYFNRLDQKGEKDEQ